MTARGVDRVSSSVSLKPSVLLSADALAPSLDVPASWLLREARADRIPHCRLGKYVRFDPVAVEAWWRERMRGPVVARTGSQPVSAGRKDQR
jgi:hypothetical protein